MKSIKSKLALGLGLALLTAAGSINIIRAADAAADDKDAIGEPTAQEKTYSSELMEATKNADYAAFMAHGDRGFKTISKSMFKSVSDQVSSRLKGGYHLVFLGAVKKGGYHTTFWKVVYDSGKDEDSLEMSVSSGKIAGALLH